MNPVWDGGEKVGHVAAAVDALARRRKSRPGASNSATLEIAKFAYLVVQPRGARLDDLEPAVQTSSHYEHD